MQLSKRQINQLSKIVATTQQILAEARASIGKGGRAGSNGGSPRRRRRGKELTAFKKTIKAERRAGASVADLARKFDVTPSYIYQLR